MASKLKGLVLVEARKDSSSIETSMPFGELERTVLSGTVVIVKGAFDPGELRRLRAEIIAANIPYRERSFDNDVSSWRDRREEQRGGITDVLYDSIFLAAGNPEDPVARAASAVLEPLAAFWRSVTGHAHTLVSRPGYRALRPWAMCYPPGGGTFRWHHHRLEPTRIGLILAMSQIGVDFQTGGTQFRTPRGIVNSVDHHDIGDICLFRYDLQHHVAPVDPERELRWDGSGRWTLLIQADPRPPDDSAH